MSLSYGTSSFFSDASCSQLVSTSGQYLRYDCISIPTCTRVPGPVILYQKRNCFKTIEQVQTDLETTIKDQDIEMTMYGYFGTNCSSTNPSYRLFLSKGTKCGALPVSISVTTDENKGEPKLVSYQITHSNGQAYIDLTDNPYCNQKDSQFSGQVAIGDCVNHSAGIRIGSVRVLNGASTNYTEFVHTSTVSTATSRITSLATTTTALLSTTTAKSQAVSTYISWSGALLLLLL